MSEPKPLSKTDLAASAANDGDPARLALALSGPKARSIASKAIAFGRTLMLSSVLSPKSTEPERAQCIAILAQHGADPDAPSADGDTPIQLAARLNRHMCLRSLIALGADFERRTLGGKLPIHLAAYEGGAESLLELSLAGADMLAVDDEGCTIVDIAKQGIGFASNFGYGPPETSRRDAFFLLAQALFDQSELTLSCAATRSSLSKSLSL